MIANPLQSWVSWVNATKNMNTRLVSFRLVSSRLVSFRLAPSGLVPSRFVPSRPVPSCLVSSRSSRLYSRWQAGRQAAGGIARNDCPY